MSNNLFFSTKKIVDLDNATIEYVYKNLAVHNQYGKEVEYEHEFSSGPIGIQGEGNIVMLGEVNAGQMENRVDIPLHSLHSMSVVRVGTGNPVLRVLTQTGKSREWPTDTPLLIAVDNGHLTVYSSTPGR